MFHAFLFDLDRTLLDVDMEALLRHYFQLLAARLAPYLPPDQARAQVLAATRTMMADTDPSTTNEAVFWADFSRRTGQAAESLRPVFEEFYAQDFPRLQVHAQALPAARPLIEELLVQERKVVIATNPVFPRVAIEQRLAWAGLADLPFAWVTTLENTHACKPHPAYFQEILAHLDCAPQEALMVGDDVGFDLPAAQVGIATFLIRTEETPEEARAQADYCGTLEEVLNF